MRECSAITRGRAAVEPEDLPAGAGPVWTGGFAFAPDGGAAPHWSSFPPALLVLPELSLLRSGDGTWLTLSAVAGAGADPDAVRAALERRLAGLRERSCRCSIPNPRARR